MIKFTAAVALFLCGQLACPAACEAAVMTRSLSIFAPGFPRQLRLPQKGQFAVCVSSPGLVSVIDENSGRITASFPSAEESFAVSPDGLTIAVVTSTSAITLYAPPAWEPVKTLEADFPRLAEFSPDGQFFVAGCRTDILYVYKMPAWERYYTLATGEDGEEELTSMAFSPDSLMFAAATAGRTGVVWDTSAWEKIDDFKAPASSVRFTYDGNYLAAPPVVYTVLPSKIKKASLPEGEERFLAAQPLSTRSLLVTAENGSLAFFDEVTRASTEALVALPGAVSEFAVASDGKFLVAASTPAGALYISALESDVATYALAEDEGAELAAQGKHEEALARFKAAKEVQDTPDIDEKIAAAGYRACETKADAAAAAGRYKRAIAEMQAALSYKTTAQGKLKLQTMIALRDSHDISAIEADAGKLEKKHEYGAAAVKLREVLVIKADARTAARIRKLEKREPAAARYRREFAQGSRALKRQDYGAAVECFTRALKYINSPEARKCLEQARNNYRR